MWSIGTLVGIPIAVLLAVGLLIAAHYLQRYRRTSPMDEDEAKWLARGLYAAVAADLIITLAVMYPFSAQYHKWTPVSGTVTRTNSRILTEDKNINQKFVFRLKGSGTQDYGCEDTRCAGVKVGDTVHLSCKRAWQYAGIDGWDCNWNE